jgi:hypothetical protein
MTQRNGYKSHRGRSAVARKTQFSGPGKVDALQPHVNVNTHNGQIISTSFFGGPKKGGSAPSSTGFSRSFATRAMVSPGLAFPASQPNYLFVFKTNPGPRPWGNGPHP